MEIIQKISQIIALEFGFWGVAAGCGLVVFLLVKESRARELLLVSALLLAGLALRIKFGFFAPMHEKIQYIEILNNYFHNYVNHDFFGIIGSYHATFGFIDFFMNRMLYFFPSFNVYHVYYINIAASLMKGIGLYFLARLLFRNKIIPFFALLAFMFFPLEIRFSASEIQSHISSLTLVLYCVFLFLYLQRARWPYLLILWSLGFANVMGRIDFAALFLVIGAVSAWPVIKRAGAAGQRRMAVILLTLFLLLVPASTLPYYIYLGRFEENPYTLHAGSLLVSGRFFPDILSTGVYMDESARGFKLPYWKFFFMPLYFYISLKCSWALMFAGKNWKKYVLLFVFTFSLMFAIGYLSRAMMKHIRLALPVFPFLCLVTACVLYEVAALFKSKKKYVFGLFTALICLSLVQNLPFFNMVMARRAEQNFLISQIQSIPDNSLLLTMTEKRFAGTDNGPRFSPATDCRYSDDNYTAFGLYFEGREFPEYLLAGRKIDVMDICQEYNPAYFSAYDNIYYYRGLYAYYALQDPILTGRFEGDHEMTEIASIDVVDHDLHSGNIQRLKAGNTLMAGRARSSLTLGFYKFIK